MTTDALTIPPDPRRKAYLESGIWSTSITLDQLFIRNVRRAPDAVMLADAQDKQYWAGTPSLQLTGAQAENIVANLVAHFSELGLKTGDVVGVQMPNCVELPLTLIACLRSGIVPALIPLLWQEKDIVVALEPLAPKALIGTTQAGPLLPAGDLRYIAASLFSVRLVMAFGKNVPDGIVDLNKTLEMTGARLSGGEINSSSADKPALITFRPTTQGFAAVVRSHNHAMCAGLAPLLESGMEPENETLLTTMQQSGLAGLATGILPWLLGGGKLILHQGYEPGLGQQIREENVTRLVLPGFLLGEIVSKLIAVGAVKTIFAVHSNAALQPVVINNAENFSVVDCYAFDEWALVTCSRDKSNISPLRLGQQVTPSTGIGPALAEIELSPLGRILLRGPAAPYNPDQVDGYQLTGYAAMLDNGALKIEGRTDRVAFIGGLAAPIDEIAGHILRLDGVEAVQINAVPDPVFGERIEARIHFSPSQEPIEQRLRRVRQECANARLAPHKLPTRFIVDPHILEQKHTLRRPAKLQAS